MKNLLLIQPGPFGDIFVCAPIAKWYADSGYKVHWPITKKFESTLEKFDYVTPIILSDEVLHADWLRSDVMKILPTVSEYDKVINLADRGPHPTAQRPNENFEICKYRLAKVPFAEKNNLVWTRNLQKEDSLAHKLNLEKPYAIVHKVDSLGQEAEVPKIDMNIVEVSEIEGYTIQDWYKVFLGASEVYCVESAVHQFMDGVANKLTKEKYLLKRPAVQQGCRFTVSSNWNLKYIGENSIIRG